MAQSLTISIGQNSQAGLKDVNQDFHGALIPDGVSLGTKGIAIAIADGISSSKVSQIASESAVKSFLTDYYCTSDAWAVKTAAQRVIAATNSWLHAESKRNQDAYDMNKGYVCTFSAMVLKSNTAHIFHIGDSRIYRLAGQGLEQLSNDHRVVLSAEEDYLGRALGMAPNVEIDYQTIKLSVGDIFILATDGVYENFDGNFVANAIETSDDLDSAAHLIVNEALRRGSADNVTIQIVRIDTLSDGEASDFLGQTQDLPLPPLLEARQEFDGYTIIRQLHGNSRSHIYLAQDNVSGEQIALKIPSIDLRDDPEYLKRLLMEEWIAKRLSNAHVLGSVTRSAPKNYLYVITEFVEGITLGQWMIDNPKPDLETVRAIVEQVAKGLRAFHRKEMLHQDLRPENIMIDTNGTVKIIDFGSTKVAGVTEARAIDTGEEILGTVQYSAPEYFIGEIGTRRADFFSLGVITYQMLTGKLPYGTQVSSAHTRALQKKLRYASAQDDQGRIPDWIDGALKKQLDINPFKRYESLSEFTGDLRTPNKAFMQNAHTPLIERNPVVFWKAVSLVLGCIIFLMLAFGN